jgi:hypothetical protein
MAPTIKSRFDELDSYWRRAEQIAEKALLVSSCRNLTLLIYFATDDVQNLRPQATQHLSRFGMVVFGLEENEVGHILPNFTPRERADVLLAYENSTFAQLYGGAVNKGHLKVARPARDKNESELRANMALVEWWIIAQAHWLFSNGQTYYSRTAASLGLGPLGAMERYDSNDRAGSVFRRDWELDACTVVYSANRSEAERCPNML